MTPPRSPRNASYSIDVTLDPASRTITASEIITWRNITTKPVDDLRFHLYWNAWRDDRSTLAARTNARPRGGPRRGPKIARAWTCSVVRLTGGGTPIDLTSQLHFIAPDDGNADDRTVLQATLPQPAAPGSTLTIEVKWTAHVRGPFARGRHRQLLLHRSVVPQTRRAAGRGGTAISSTRHGVLLRLRRLRRPHDGAAGWPVGATGVERDRRDNADGTTTHRYYQDDVHDFAWTTSPDYLERTARFEHPRRCRPSRCACCCGPSTRARPTAISTHAAALRYYGEWFGAYPYGHITIVDPAFQSGARRHGIPDALHGRLEMVAPVHGRRSRRS